MPIYGWDMSHYDAVNSNTAELVISEGFQFVTHKAGGDANDAEIGPFWTEFKNHRDKLLLGAYWVLYPGSGAARADTFCDRLDATCPGWGDAPFILQVDCEKWNNDVSTVPSKADIKAFCDRLRVRAPKLMPIVYAPEWVYGNALNGLGYPLWASAYVNGQGTASGLYPGDSSSKWDAYSGQVPAVLQFTSSATIAGQTTCDANAYKGTLAQLTALVAPGWDDDMGTVDSFTSGALDALSQAVASKIHLDLTTPASGLAKDVVAIVKTVPTAASIATAVWAAMPNPEQVDVELLASALSPLLNQMTIEEIKTVFTAARFSFAG